jgi:hypothetical protein
MLNDTTTRIGDVMAAVFGVGQARTRQRAASHRLIPWRSMLYYIRIRRCRAILDGDGDSDDNLPPVGREFAVR